MRSFWGLKISLSSCFVFWIFGSFAQNEPIAITSYKDKKVFYTDLGYNTSPFRIKYPFNENTHFFLALEHLERKEYDDAIKAFKKLKRENLLGTEKLILLENKLKKIGFSNDLKNLND